LNEIYTVLRVYKNFCLPTIRLKSKERVEGRIKRKYDKRVPPTKRLMESNQVTEERKRELRRVYESMNPAALYRRITELREQLEEASRRQSGRVRRAVLPWPRGPRQQAAQPHGGDRMNCRPWGGAPPPRPRKPFFQGGELAAIKGLPLVGRKRTQRCGGYRAFGLHFHLTQPTPVWLHR